MAPKLVLAFRIRECCPLALGHRVGDFRQQRRRCIVIEINRRHGENIIDGGERRNSRPRHCTAANPIVFWTVLLLTR